MSNASTFNLQKIFVRACGTKPWSTKLMHAQPTAPNTTATLTLDPGCYDLVAVTDKTKDGVKHRHAPGLQVTADKPAQLTLATSEFQNPDHSKACVSTKNDAALGESWVVGGQVIMDQMLDPTADAYVRQEFAYQTNFFTGLPQGTVLYGLLDSSGPNAVTSPTGFIAFGDNLYQIHGVQQHGAPGVDASLAHEYGHRVQQTMNWFNNDQRYNTFGADSVLPNELEADAFAGFYEASPGGKNVNQTDLSNMFNHFYSLGSEDFDFSNPAWHGTKYQRYASNYIGAQTAYLAVQYAHTYTYQELHDTWMQTILNDIVQNPSATITEALPPLSGRAAELYDRLPHQKIAEIALGISGW